VQDADAGSRDYRPDGAPTRARRLRVPKMRVCDERLGVKRDEPPDGSATEGARRCRLAHLIFHPRDFHIISALGRAIPRRFYRRPRRRGDPGGAACGGDMSLPGTKPTCPPRRSMSVYWVPAQPVNATQALNFLGRGKADIQQTSPNDRV
jgi:hypothetical protein